MNLRVLIKEELEHLSKINDTEKKIVELFNSFKKAQQDPTQIKVNELKNLVSNILTTLDHYNQLASKYKELTGVDFSKFYKKLKSDMALSN